MYQNLHCHTKTSDGELGYKQVLDVSSQNNVSAVAFTDHDALPDKKAMKLLEKNRAHPVKWIVGVEISSGWPREIDGPASNFHLVGLFVNPFDKNLVEHCQKAQKARVERMEKMVKNLKLLGFDLSKDDCLKESDGEAVGRPHIVSALTKKEKNLKIIEKLKEKMAKQAKRSLRVRKKYNEMLRRGEHQYPYALFLNSEAFLSNVYVDYLYYKDMDQSVGLIRKAGGVAILAHWSFSKNKVNGKMIKKFFKEKRLDGGEIVFGADRAVNLKDKKIIKDIEAMAKLTQKADVFTKRGR